MTVCDGGGGGGGVQNSLNLCDIIYECERPLDLVHCISESSLDCRRALKGLFADCVVGRLDGNKFCR